MKRTRQDSRSAWDALLLCDLLPPALSFQVAEREEREVDIRLQFPAERIGFSLTTKFGVSFVYSVTPGGSADRAGLALNDQIVAVNGFSVLAKSHTQLVDLIHQCIRTRSISLRVRRKVYDKTKTEVNSDSARVVDAFLVSINKESVPLVIDKIARTFPYAHVVNMEDVAGSSNGSNGTQLLVPQVHNGSAARQEKSSITELTEMPAGAPSEAPSRPTPTDDLDESEDLRLRRYEQDIRERRERQLEKHRQQSLLRSSLRSSKKLKALSESSGRKNETGEGGVEENAEEEQAETSLDGIRGYANHCYVVGDISFRENLDKHMEANHLDDSMPLDQVIGCVERVALHLESSEGRGDDSRFLRDFFQSKPVQTAIQATAVHQKPPGPSDDIRIVTLHKEDDTYLGATVRVEEGRVVVGRVVAGGSAEQSGHIQEGDELLDINGVEVRGRSVEQVCEMLRGFRGELRLVLGIHGRRRKPRVAGPLLQLRALFDYDPDDDIFVPCRELALSFRRGDVLHVLDRSDPSWWQATVDGCDENRNLAGIIPSPAFRYQVLQYKDEMAAGAPKSRREARKKLPQVLARTLKRGSKEPVSADEKSATLETENAAEVSGLGYEEVVLHLARSEHKRPLVLVGAEGVGCLAVRQALLDRLRDRVASPVPYTSRPARPGEANGVHYHFVSRSALVAMNKAGELLEFGEYDGHLYGTALADIARLRYEGKTPLLSLKPESISSVRCGLLMPFVVLLAAPPLPVLSKQRPNHPNDTLRALISSSRTVEEKYGHVFDEVVVNAEQSRTVSELAELIHRLETEPFWVPSTWVGGSPLSPTL